MTQLNQPIDQQAKSKSCHHCVGQGYTEIRDCSGEIQRTEICSYCEGQGTKKS